MVSNSVVRTAEHYLFGDIELPNGFHEKFSDFMNMTYARLQCVVLYKPSRFFSELLSEFPELPDIGRKEFMVVQSGALKFSPDYFNRPLNTISIINFVNDKVVTTATKYLFGVNSISLDFHDSFTEFIVQAYRKSDEVVLSYSNKKFATFLRQFFGLPSIGRRKLVIYSSGRMFFTPDQREKALEEIFVEE